MQTTKEKVIFITLSERKPAPKVGKYVEHKNAIVIKKLKGDKIEVYYTDQNGLVMKTTQGGAVDNESFKELINQYLSENKEEIKRVLELSETNGDPDVFSGISDAEFLRGFMEQIEELKPVSYNSLISELIGERPNTAFVKVVPVKFGGILSLFIEIWNSQQLVGQKMSLGTQNHYKIPTDMTIETILGTLYMKKNGEVEFFVKYAAEDECIRTSTQISL